MFAALMFRLSSHDSPIVAIAKRSLRYGQTRKAVLKDFTSNASTDAGTLHVPPQPKLSVQPMSALVDQPVKITVSGLQRYQPVTLSTRVTSDGGNEFQCHSYYTSDEVGKVDLTRDPSLGGCYDGIEPMGLFWASKISPDSERPYSRLGKTDVTTPQIVTVSVYEDHVKKEDLESHSPKSSLDIERWYMSHDVKRIPLSGGNIEGVLFVPKSQGPFPGVIDLRGGVGDIMESRPALMASYGFVTLALKYQGYAGSNVEPMQMEYFENALDFLAGQDKVRGCGVGVLGTSTGGIMVATMAGLFPKLGCSVITNGVIYTVGRSVSYKGRVWEHLPWDRGTFKQVDGVWNVRDSFEYQNGDDFHKYVLPFKDATSPILFVVSDDDSSIHQDIVVSHIKQSMRSVKNENYEIVRYPGAGHLLEHPYTPLIPATYFSRDLPEPVMYGGKVKEHARAQEDSWKRILHFLRCNLSPQSTTN